MPEPKQSPAPLRKAWSAPRLTRLGTIADVAGSSNLNGQTANKIDTRS